MARTRGERGASAVEYALLIAVCAVVLIGGLKVLGLTLGAAYTNSCSGSGDTGVHCCPPPPAHDPQCD